jgi:hypothetical protein
MGCSQNIFYKYLVYERNDIPLLINKDIIRIYKTFSTKPKLFESLYNTDETINKLDTYKELINSVKFKPNSFTPATADTIIYGGYKYKYNKYNNKLKNLLNKN